MIDRKVHAEDPAGEQIVRYDRAGKWYIELVEPSMHAPARKQIDIGEAVDRAFELEDMGTGKIHLGLPGGRRFDHLVRERRET